MKLRSEPKTQIEPVGLRAARASAS